MGITSTGGSGSVSGIGRDDHGGGSDWASGFRGSPEFGPDRARDDSVERGNGGGIADTILGALGRTGGRLVGQLVGGFLAGPIGGMIGTVVGPRAIQGIYNAVVNPHPGFTPSPNQDPGGGQNMFASGAYPYGVGGGPLTSRLQGSMGSPTLAIGRRSVSPTGTGLPPDQARRQLAGIVPVAEQAVGNILQGAPLTPEQEEFVNAAIERMPERERAEFLRTLEAVSPRKARQTAAINQFAAAT